MAFVNEYMSEADIAKYRIEEINRRFIRFDYRPHWTRDADRDLYLRQVARGREEFSQQVDFTFYWRETLYVLRLVHHAAGTRGGTGTIGYELLTMAPECEAPTDRQRLLADLKEALKAYGAGGVFADMTVTRMSFDF